MAQIIPAILAHDAIEFAQKLRKVEGLVDMVQVDCMDGEFVPDATWCDGVGVQTMATPTTYDLHLMVKDPMRIIEEWQDVPTAQRATFHIEATDQPLDLIREIERHGLEPCVAINPETPLARITPLLSHVESVLVMGVHPGASGQSMVPGTLERIRELRALSPELPIAVDGGVTMQNVQSLIEAGATRIIAASMIYRSKDIKATVRELQRL